MSGSKRKLLKNHMARFAKFAREVDDIWDALIRDDLVY